MAFFSFGKKRKVRRQNKKPPPRLLKLCKKYRVKATKRVRGKIVYRTSKVLKTLCLRKAKKLLKSLKKKGTRKSHRRRHRRSGFGNLIFGGTTSPAKTVSQAVASAPIMSTSMSEINFDRIGRGVADFNNKCVAEKGNPITVCASRILKFGRRRSGFGEMIGAPFQKPENYGYNQKVVQAQQALSQTNTPNGVNREFFGQQVPTQIPPYWDFMGQPGGAAPYAVGAPHYQYPTAISSFGRRRGRPRGGSRCAPRRPRYRRYNVAGSPCNLKRMDCKLTPGCSYVKYRGCRRKPQQEPYPWDSMIPSGGGELDLLRNDSDENLGAYGEAAGITFFGRRRRRGCAPRRPRYRRYNVAGSPCNLTMQQCKTFPGSVNCQYVKNRGCRRRPQRLPYPWDSVGQSMTPPMTPSDQGEDTLVRGDEDMGALQEAVGVSFFGRRRAGFGARGMISTRKKKFGARGMISTRKKKFGARGMISTRKKKFGARGMISTRKKKFGTRAQDDRKKQAAAREAEARAAAERMEAKKKKKFGSRRSGFGW
jgi:hypothetical protein